MQAWIWRSRGIFVGAVAALALASCGSSQRQDAHEPRGKFKVAVTTATFPAAQRLAQHTHLVIVVRNSGPRAIPNLAVTICNVTCAYNAPKGEGTSVQAFSQALNQPNLANPSRPIWIIDRPPGPCLYSCRSGGQGAYVTAYSNTWALGHQLPAGQTATFDWGVTAVAAGSYVVAWEVAAGIDGKAKAVLPDGSQPSGTFVVHISSKPRQAYVTPSGKIVYNSGQ